MSTGKKLQSKYEFDLNNVSTYDIDVADFYITQRLDKSYADNILGKIKKEVDSYKTDNTSNWVAYGVTGVWGEAYPNYDGDIYVIHAGNKNPFSQSGAYEVTYVNTGKTTHLTNSDGFSRTAPIFTMVSNYDTVAADLEQYWDCIFAQAEAYGQLLSLTE